MTKEKKLLSVCDGEAVALSEVPDEVFASGMLGRGFAVLPETGIFFAPADAKIENITQSLHAYSLRSDDGLDILVHIGIDTVDLGGKGFTPCVKVGDHVRAGEIIARADIELIKKNGYSTATPVVISNADELLSHKLSLGKVEGGESAVLTYIK